MAKSTTQNTVAMTSDALKVTMKELDTLFEFSFESKRPFVIWGDKAVGKTTRVKEVAAKHGYRLETLHLATQDITDLIGMMAKVPEEEDFQRLQVLFEESTMGKDLSDEEFSWVKQMMMNPRMKTVWTRPEWLHNDPDVKTIYFLDEMNRGNKFVSAAMLPFLNEGKLHAHSKGPNDVVIAACNPSTPKFSVNSAFEHDEALKDRCGHCILEPTKDEWFKYSETKLDPLTISVLRANTHFIELSSFDLPFKVTPSRRSLVDIMSIVGKKDDLWVRRNASTVVGCYLGTAFLKVWWDARFQKDQYIEIEDLFNISDTKNKITNILTAMVNGVATVKSDIYEESLDKIVDWINDDYKDGSTRLDWLSTYWSLPIIPKDTIMSTLSKVDVLTKPYLAEHFISTDLLNMVPDIANLKTFDKLLKGEK